MRLDKAQDSIMPKANILKCGWRWRSQYKRLRRSSSTGEKLGEGGFTQGKVREFFKNGKVIKVITNC